MSKAFFAVRVCLPLRDHEYIGLHGLELLAGIVPKVGRNLSGYVTSESVDIGLARSQNAIASAIALRISLLV